MYIDFKAILVASKKHIFKGGKKHLRLNDVP